MDAMDSDSRVTAQLSRLIGLAGAQLHEHLSEAALGAAGALCDFDLARGMRTKCLKAAAAVAAGGKVVADKVMQIIFCANALRLEGRDVYGCAVEILLTLLEGASIRGGAPPEGQSGVVFVTGQRSWLLDHSWAIRSAHVAALLGGQRVMRSLVQSPGDLQRKVVMAAATKCASTHSRNVHHSSSNLVSWLSAHCVPFTVEMAQGACEAWQNVLLCLLLHSSC